MICFWKTTYNLNLFCSRFLRLFNFFVSTFFVKSRISDNFVICFFSFTKAIRNLEGINEIVNFALFYECFLSFCFLRSPSSLYDGFTPVHDFTIFCSSIKLMIRFLLLIFAASARSSPFSTTPAMFSDSIKMLPAAESSFPYGITIPISLRCSIIIGVGFV